MANNEVKKLAGQTAIYGGTTVLSRLLNYLLVPLHTYLFSNAADYGVVGELYAWTSLFIVILTYGMETAFFKFSQDDEIKDRVYSTVVGSLLVTSTLFIVLCSVFAQPIADWLRYPTHPEYVRWFAVIIGVDALTSIFFAHLRFLNRPIRFAAVKITNILVNVLLNLFFLLLCPWLLTKNPDSAFVNAIYNPEIGVGYIFIANLVASVVTLLMLFPGILKQKFVFDWQLWKKMFRYAFPLLILGLAGIVNETMDRVLIKRLSLAAEPQASVGIYSACYKISILMTIFIQAFKYAAEPFFFRKAKDKDAKETYAEVMTAFVLVCSVIFVHRAHPADGQPLPRHLLQSFNLVQAHQSNQIRSLHRHLRSGHHPGPQLVADPAFRLHGSSLDHLRLLPLHDGRLLPPRTEVLPRGLRPQAHPLLSRLRGRRLRSELRGHPPLRHRKGLGALGGEHGDFDRVFGSAGVDEPGRT